MNQILYTKSSKSNASIDIKKIIIFFSIALIMVGIAIAIRSSFIIYERNKQAKLNANPKLILTQDANYVIVNVEHNKEISKIEYSWNESGKDTIYVNKTSGIEEKIEIPVGINVLYISAEDIEGRKVLETKRFEYQGISIELTVVDNSKIKIKAEDSAGLKEIKYKWNTEEEIVVNPQTEGDTIIEQETKIPQGLNTLTVTATNINDETQEKTQDIKGVLPPTIKVARSGNDLIVMISDEEGLTKLIHKQNDKQKEITIDNVKQYNYRYKLDEGYNLVEITVTNIEGVTSTFAGQCER